MSLHGRRSWLVVALGSLLWQTAVAMPGEPGPANGPGRGMYPGPHHHPAPDFRPGPVIEVLPPGYQTVLIAGLTYFVLNDIWYRMQGGRYVVVDKPSDEPRYEQPHGLTQVDIDGVRYYVRDGRFYRRNADGEYLEVPPPASQRSNN